MKIHIHLDTESYIFCKDNQLTSSFCYSFDRLIHINTLPIDIQNSIREGIDSSLLIDNEIEEVRIIVAQYGSDEDRDKLIKDTWKVLEKIAQYGNESHKLLLIDYPHYRVRLAIAEYGDNEMRKYLLSDQEITVRNVAQALVTQ